MKTILITGASGYIGRAVADTLSGKFKIVRTSRRGLLGTIKMDITEQKQMEIVLENINPDAIIHAAALKDVRKCEDDPAAAKDANVTGTLNISKFAKARKCYMIYISTDHVFEGTQGNYHEGDAANPWTVYGRTKLEGERIVAQSISNHAICRLSGVYSEDGNNILAFILHNLRNGIVQEYFDDVYNSPVHLQDVASSILRIVEMQAIGTFHIAGPSRLSRFELAKMVAEKLAFSQTLVKPIRLGDDKRKQQLRLYDVSLNDHITKKQLGINPRAVIEAIDTA